MQELFKITRILVPIDGSETSFKSARYALGLAKMSNATVALLHVSSVPAFPKYFETLDKYEEEVKKEANEWFERIRGFSEAKGVEIKSMVNTLALSIVEGILYVADEWKADLIIIGPRGRSKFTKLLLGSVTNGIVNYSTCPVLVVR